MTENLDSYAKAFAELENNEKDLGTWAKAFSETSSEDDAKKLYIKLRVEQLDAGNRSEEPRRPIAQEKPDQTTPHSSTTTFIDSEDEQGDKHPYKNMIIVSLGLALMYFLFMVLAESKNGIGPIIWSWTAYWIYKREIRGVVMIQKIWVSIATILGVFGVGSWISSDHAPLLYSYVDLIFSVLVSLGLHYWFLQHFQRELPDSYSKWSFQALLPDASGKPEVDALAGSRNRTPDEKSAESPATFEEAVSKGEPNDRMSFNADDVEAQRSKNQELENFWLMLILVLIAIIGIVFVLVTYDESSHAKNHTNKSKQSESISPSVATAKVNGCAYSLKSNDFQVTERSGGSIVKHLASHRFIFVDTGSTSTAIRKAKTQFFEKYEDMCP
jgi:hypothetical protein